MRAGQAWPNEVEDLVACNLKMVGIIKIAAAIKASAEFSDIISHPRDVRVAGVTTTVKINT